MYLVRAVPEDHKFKNLTFVKKRGKICTSWCKQTNKKEHLSKFVDNLYL